jgi:hypothetical protein
MGARGPTQFVLTLKGTEELAQRTYRLDVKVRNILFLIQKGTPTVEAILQNSIFPREEVVEKLRGLLRDQFVALEGAATSPSDPPTAPPQRAAGRATAIRNSDFPPTRPVTIDVTERPGTIDMSSIPGTLNSSIRPGTVGLTSIVIRAAQNGSFAAPSSEYPMLDAGISVSQARFVLCDFCLDQFGMKAQTFIDAINATADVGGLQEVLDRITREVRKQRRENMPALLSRVREINELRA